VYLTAEYEAAPEILTLEQEGNTHSFTDSLLKDAIIVVPEEFLRVFGTWTQRDYLRCEVQHFLSTLDTKFSYFAHVLGKTL